MEVHLQSPKQTKQPARTCVACRAAGSKDELVRVVLGEDRKVVVDLSQSAFGRGAWVHGNKDCIARAARGLSKSFKSEVRTTPRELLAGVAAAADRRVEGLLSAARRAGRLVAGASAVDQEIAAGRARLVIVSADARAAAGSREVQQMIAAGRAAVWGNTERLGEALLRPPTAVAAVLDVGLARGLGHAIELSHVADVAEEG